MKKFRQDRRENDISHFVLPKGSQWEPDSVSISYTPDGQKKVTYSTESETGVSDDVTKQAMMRIQAQTQIMQNQASALETFVRRNRSLFPVG